LRKYINSYKLDIVSYHSDGGGDYSGVGCAGGGGGGCGGAGGNSSRNRVQSRRQALDGGAKVATLYEFLMPS